MPDQSGKTAVITGANGGLGLKIALELARKGATVVLACRNLDKGQQAVEQISQQVSNAKLDLIPLDLIEIESVKAFCAVFHQRYQQLDLLINNAGVVHLERLQRAPNGQELQMATNFLGHYALTVGLADLLLATPNARVVTTTSATYKYGAIDFDDFRWETRRYNKITPYADSKLACLLFAHQLQKYFTAKQASAISVAAQPSMTATERQQAEGIGGFVAHWIAAPLEKGVRPQLLAATANFVKGGDFYAPRYEARGKPVLQKVKAGVLDDSVAQKLWDYAAQITGVSFP